MNHEVNATIARNRGLIFLQMKKFGLLRDPEAESIGYEALLNAFNTFEPRMGYQFSTYASVCIYNALGSYQRTQNRQRQLTVISYHATHEENGLELLGVIPGVGCVEDGYLKDELHTEVRNAFNELHARVTNPKHVAILSAWLASDFEATTKDIAAEVGVSQSYVSQVLNNFKYSMRKRMEAYVD